MHVTVTGSVQGVFFRATTKEKADELGITGWVYNTGNGNVEIHAEGSPDVLENLKAWCHKGPPAARVDHVEIKEVLAEGFRSFEVRK